jgi:uncharacterized protein (DUF305 family)
VDGVGCQREHARTSSLERVTVQDTEDVALVESAAEGRGRLRIVLFALIAVAVLAASVAGGYAWGSHGSSSSVQPNAVDVGFARDMAAHHQQAVTMATYVQSNSPDPNIRNLAYDIESSQTAQLGEMTGWLDTWGLTRYSAHPMVWMGAQHAAHVVNGLLPGMATPAQMDKLTSSHGKALDILFLQLMIHHHQGGIPMARFAVLHANEDYVRTLAGHILAIQSTEIIQMEQLLRQLGSQPLPPPLT